MKYVKTRKNLEYKTKSLQYSGYKVMVCGDMVINAPRILFKLERTIELNILCIVQVQEFNKHQTRSNTLTRQSTLPHIICKKLSLHIQEDIADYPRKRFYKCIPISKVRFGSYRFQINDLTNTNCK